MNTSGPWKCALDRVDELRDQRDALLTACEATEALPNEAQEIMRHEGFVIDNLDDRWQKLVFTLYTMIAANAGNAAAAIAKARGDV